MSFRTRLTSFFLLIVLIPMTTVGFLVFRLIDDSQQGKADARANGLASAAASVYDQASRSASYDAETVARALAPATGRNLAARARAISTQVGIVRLTVAVGGRVVVDLGSRTALAPGIASVRSARGRARRVITLSELSAGQYAGQLKGSDFGVVVRQGQDTLANTFPAATGHRLPGAGEITLHGARVQVVTLGFAGFGATPVSVSVVSDNAAAAGSVATARLVAVVFILAFVILAAAFALLASRALQGQLHGFLEAARRLAGGDFSSPIETYGDDEFAALGAEFNNMAEQLRQRLEELEHEQARVRRSIRNIGDAFASNLDRTALLELALKTALDATEADRGRITAREHSDAPLTEVGRQGDLDGLDEPVLESERLALEADGLGHVDTDELSVATVALGQIVASGPSHGLITVVRARRPFGEHDLALLRSLAVRASLALANVDLHFDVQRQAVTDDLTGLTTHGRFQELLGTEMDEVRRYRYPVGLVMLDLDDFKAINDAYGHQQGDVVLRTIAEVMRETKRDVDVAARYGGEELALILPHTDLDGTYVIGERLREAIAEVEIPLLNSDGNLHVTASVGAAASADGDRAQLIADADAALYTAKREGKNRTIRATEDTARALTPPLQEIPGDA